jgi:hypothetical protein
MEAEGSVPCSQEPVTVPYPKPDECSPHILTLFPDDAMIKEKIAEPIPNITTHIREEN